jgi:hypothetical protein
VPRVQDRLRVVHVLAAIIAVIVQSGAVRAECAQATTLERIPLKRIPLNRVRLNPSWLHNDQIAVRLIRVGSVGKTATRTERSSRSHLPSEIAVSYVP